MVKSLHHRLGSAVGAGALAGLAAGIIMGIAMHAQGMMTDVARIVGTENLLAGWVYHLFNSAVIGALFGLILGRGALNYRQGLLRGGLYGVGWWILGGLILMPLMLGMPAFAPLRMAEMHGVALFSLVGHIIFGVLLGAGYAYLHVTSPFAKRREAPTTTK